MQSALVPEVIGVNRRKSAIHAATSLTVVVLGYARQCSLKVFDGCINTRTRLCMRAYERQAILGSGALIVWQTHGAMVDSVAEELFKP